MVFHGLLQNDWSRAKLAPLQPETIHGVGGWCAIVKLVTVLFVCLSARFVSFKGSTTKCEYIYMTFSIITE